MRCLITLSLCFLLVLRLAAQDFKSIHQLASEEDNLILLETKPSEFPGHSEIIPLNLAKSSALEKCVFGYLRPGDYSNWYSQLRFDLLTHIAAFSFSVNSSTGAVGNPTNWPWTTLINQAHLNGVKVIMCVTCFDKDDIRVILTDSTVKNNFFTNVKNKINSYNLDGVNIDFEGPYTADRGSLMNGFMSDLTNYIQTNLPGKEVSFAGPAVNWSGWDFPGLAAACDYIFIMGYDYFGSWSSTTGPSAPLTGGSINVTKTLTNSTNGYYDVVRDNPEKLILGVPYYGNWWRTNSNAQNSTTRSFVSSPRFKDAEPQSQIHGKLWASDYQTPWYRYYDTVWNQIWFDDSLSLAYKYDLAISKNLKGVGMWALGYDGYRTEYWNLLQNKFVNDNRMVIIADFDTSKIPFDKTPTYSGSTKGVSSSSSAERNTTVVRNGEGALNVLLIDDAGSSNDWHVRLVSGGGSPANNQNLYTPGFISLWLKTNSAPANSQIAITVDDSDGTELSPKLDIINDGEWNIYEWNLSETGWTNFANGNGKIDGSLVTLDAIMFYAPNNSPNWEFYIDDVIFSPASMKVYIGNGLNTATNYTLYQNFPNPFNPETSINYELNKHGRIKLAVYDALGREITVLVNETKTAGKHSVKFNAEGIPSGVYFYRIQTEDFTQTKKMILCK